MEASVILVLLVLPGAFAGPIQWQAGDNMCSTHCPESNKYKYETGTSYEYRYEAETRTTMSGAAEDTATIALTATAVVEVLGHCEMALRLTDVSIKRSHEQTPSRMVNADDMSRARRALEGQSLRFAFHDGAVGELCPGDDEDLWALNIKRGVLTSFQNSMRQLDREEHTTEADVTGNCPTHYKTTQQGWKTLKVSKVKDMLSCTDRHGYRTSLLSASYHSPDSLQSLPLMKSSHECEHDVSQSDVILTRSSCQEVHVFRPFSKATSGAVTEASQTLTFRSKSSGVKTQKGQVSRRTTLVYEHKLGMTTGQSAFNDVKDKLQEICEVTKVDIRPQVPQIFGDLVHLMRNLDYSDLQNIDRQLQKNRICTDNAKKTRKFFQDALPMAATGASLRMMNDLLTTGEVKDAQATFWLTSLAFLPNPTKEMVAAVHPLLTSAKTQQDAMLAVSSLVNNYCQTSPACGDDQEVQNVMDALTGILGDDCNVNDNNFKQVLLTLRAIGNIGRSEAASLRLQPCFTKSDLPMDVRVAALDAYRRMPCTADRNNVMEIFRRHSEDSELRIAAYLAVMKCPSQAVLTQVRQALTDEKVNQVGSFVWTHLTNLLETESPHKQDIRDVLESELLQREFSKDRRKYSRNYELSFFSEKFNLGGIYENNIIWSPSSFVPRSAMLNLTVDMFGHSVNLLEVGGRVQGLEYLLDTYWGPSSEDSGKEGGYGRSDVVKDEKMARTKKRFGKVKDDLRAQLYMRVMGNELSYSMLDGKDVTKLRDGKARSFLDDLMAKLMKDGEVAVTQSAMFMDTTIVIPTAIGLPLNLTVNGSASVELQASQKIDFKRINAKSKAFEIAADIQPSGAVEFSSMMSVDAFVTQVGLKMTSRLHSSTSLKGRVELARGQILSVEIDTPRETQELFDFQSKFYIVHDTYEKEQMMVTANRKEKTACTGNALAKVVGMELCASLSFPNATLDLDAPYFPLTGPTHVALTLRKHDVHSGYRLFAKQIQTSNSIISQLTLDTPGSKMDRAISLGYVANLKDRSMEADLLSPWKKVSLKASMANTKKMYKAVGEVTVDTDKEYKVQLQVDKDIRDRKLLVAKIKPTLVVTSPDGTVLSLQGALDYKQDKQVKTSLTVEMKDVLKKPFTVDYALTMRGRQDKMRYKNNLKLSSQFATVKMTTSALVGSFTGNKRSALLTVRSRADYNLHVLPGVKRNIVNMGLKIHDRSTPAIKKYGVNLNFDTKQTPDSNVLINGEVSHKKTLTELEVKVRHGKNIKVKDDPSKELLLSGFVAHTIKDPQATVRFDLKVVYPEKDIEYQVKGKHEHTKKSVEDYFTLRYAKGKSVDAHLRLDQGKKKRSATFDLSYPAGQFHAARDIKINADLLEKSSAHHVFSAMTSLKKGEKNSLVVSFRRPTKTSVDISGEMELHDRLPIKLDISGNVALRNMRGQGQLTAEGKTYSVNYTSDIQENQYAKITLDAVHPERRLKGLLEGGKDTEEGVKRAKVEVMWDADDDPSQKAGVTMEMADKVAPGDVNIGGMVEVFTPVTEYKQLKAELRFENSRRRTLTLAETVLGDKQREYSAKFLLKHPVTKNSFNTQAWIKTPYRILRHAELAAKHTFDPSSSLSTSLKGKYNSDFVDMGLSGGSNSDIITRLLEGSAFFKSSIPGGENFRLSFNHRDANGGYSTQTVMNANGDQYSADMEADFTKVHWQVSTSGTVTIRTPQLTTPAQVIWSHSNNLHQLTSSVTLNFENNQEVQFEVGGKANIVAHIYDGSMKLRGPWKENRAEHVSQLEFHYEETQRKGYDFSTRLELDQDSYVLKHSRKRNSGAYETSISLAMSRFPEYSFLHTCTLRVEDFPYLMSVELQVAEEPILTVDVEVENPRTDVYRSNSRVAVFLEGSMETVAIKARHEKNRRNQWVTKGDLEYDLGHSVSFENVLDYQGDKKMLKLTVDTPYDQMRNLAFEYSHSGNVLKDFQVTSSLSVAPQFDTVTAKLSYANRNVFEGSLRVETPFEELRYLEVNGNSNKKGSKRHSSLTVDYSPSQVYKLDTVYTLNFPDDVDVSVNLTTPLKELPSLYTEFGFQGTGEEVKGKFKLIGPVTNFQEVSTNFGHRRTASSVSTQLDAVTSPGKSWSGRANLDWNNEVQGTVSITNSEPGPQPFELSITHQGHTWNDFHTKAGFKMNGDRLESELGYSDKDGHSVVFMLATPDPELDYFKTTFFKRLTESNFEMNYTAQYGEQAKPFEFGLNADYPDCRLGFSTEVRTPHSENLAIEFGLGRCSGAEMKLLGMYGSNNKIDTLLKYKIEDKLYDMAAEFEYIVHGSGRNVGLAFKREGSLEDLRCQATAKYMGKQVNVDTQYRDADKKTGRVDVRTNFQGYRELAASFDHSGDSATFNTDLYLKVKDDKEAKATIDFTRNKWKRVTMTTTFNLPLEEYENNKLTYKHNYRKNKLSADASLTLGLARPITGELEFVDNSRLTVSVTGPYKDFESFTATGTFDETDLRLDGDSTLRLLSQPTPITSTYMVRAGIWPVMVNVKAQTPFDGWRNVEFSTTHDGGITDFTTSNTLTADAVGTITSETVWTYTSPFIFDGKWTLSSTLEGAEDLKLFVKNSKVGSEHSARIILGWELLKELVLETTLQIGDDYSDDTRYRGSVAMTTPFPDASQVSLAFDHSHNDRRIQDAVVTKFNDQTYLDADFSYTVDDRRVGTLEFREPRPMAFLIGGRHTATSTEGELMLNWDKRVPEMNVHLSGDYTDRTDSLGTDKTMKMWVVHPARTMGVEYLLKKAAKEFQTDFLLTWNKASGQTLSYIVNWTDRSSRYSSAYDAMVKVGVPMRSVQVEGMYSNTGRAQAAEGSLMWDADHDKNMKVGVKGQLDKRGKANKVQLGLDLPFADKEFSLTTEAAVNSGNTILDSRTEFSYSVDPRKLLVFTTRVDDLSYGTSATNYSLEFGVIHPMTDVNIQMTSHVGDSQTLSSMGSRVVYLTSQREKKMVEIRGQIDKLRRLMGVELRSPVKNVALEGQLTPSMEEERSGDTNYNVRLATTEDGEKTKVTDIFVNPKTKTFELTYRYDKAQPKNTLNLFGVLMGDNVLQTEVYRMQEGQRVSEALMTLRLNSSHVLHTRLNWRPSMLNDLQQYLSTQLTVHSYASSQTFTAVAEAVGNELEAKYLVIMQEVREEAAPLLQQLQREMGQVQTQLDSVQRDMRRFYHSNALHVQDMGQVVVNGLDTAVNGLQYVVFEYRKMYTQIQQDIDQAMRELGQYPMAQRYAQLVSDFAGGLKNSRVVLEQALDELSGQVSHFSDVTYRKYLIISRQIDRKLEGYTAALRQTPQYQGLSKAYTTARTSLMQLSQGQYKQLADAAHAKLMGALDAIGVKDTYVIAVSKGKQLIADQFHDIVQRPEFQQIYVIGNEIYQQSVWAYHYWHVEKNARLAVAQVLELTKDIALLEITRVKNAVVDLDKSRVIVFDPQNGELQFEIYLPVPLKSLTEPPDMRLTKYVNRVKSWAATYIPSPRHSVWTSINNYLPNIDTDTWIAPYPAYAYVMGDQHVVTFDRKHYNFAGRCSYILARDMADDRFSVVLHYNNRPRQPQVQSLVVMLRGVSVEVDRDSKVKVNNRETELPFFSGPISAVREHNIVRIQDGQALTVEMDSERGIYSVAVSGWYHGRTAGLLGIYDNEPYNDLTDATGRLTTDVEALSNSWEVSQRYCRSRNLAEDRPLDRGLEEVIACEKHLNYSSSYYSPCFGQVDAGELVGVCVEYVRSGLTVQEAQCKAGQQYRYMCHRRGVALGTPKACVSCEMPSGERVTAGSSQQVNLNPTSQDASKAGGSADVVFVVEESGCNSWAQRSLSTLATELGQALKTKGLTANRFGLVSYHGNGSRDQQLVHTIEGKVFGEPGNFLKATENLRLTYPGEQGNVAEALREALKYPFRTGVAKVLVLLPCSNCTGDMLEVTQVLTSHGFVLHVLKATDFQVTGGDNHSPVRIFGLDLSKVHTQRSAARNSDAIFRKLQKPRDACAQLALSTNGSVFDVKHMSERGRIQNEFLESFATRSALNARPPTCQVCSCHDDGNGRGHTVCRLCDNHSWMWNHIPTWLQSGSTSVMGVFNDLHHQIISSLQIPNTEVSAAA